MIVQPQINGNPRPPDIYVAGPSNDNNRNDNNYNNNNNNNNNNYNSSSIINSQKFYASSLSSPSL